MITNFTRKNKTALFRRDETLGKTMTLAGPKAWTVDEVITLCEKYADAEADVSLPCIYNLSCSAVYVYRVDVYAHKCYFTLAHNSTVAACCLAQQVRQP